MDSGSHVADELSKRGHEVIIFDKKSKWIKKSKIYIWQYIRH